MCGERIAASVYEQTGDLHEALMGASMENYYANYHD